MNKGDSDEMQERNELSEQNLREYFGQLSPIWFGCKLDAFFLPCFFFSPESFMVGMELSNRNGFVGKAESSKELLASGVEIMLTNDHKQLLIVLRS